MPTHVKDHRCHKSLPFNTRLMPSYLFVFFPCVSKQYVPTAKTDKKRESELWISSQLLWNDVLFFLSFCFSSSCFSLMSLGISPRRTPSTLSFILFVSERGIFTIFTSPIKSVGHLWLQRGWNCCLLGVQTWLLSDLRPFIFQRKRVISEDNLLLRLWTAHQPLAVCSGPTVICRFEKEQRLCNLMQGFYG